MLRKRASFKPNLKQVNPQQPVASSALASATPSTCPPAPSQPISSDDGPEPLLLTLPAAENVVNDGLHQQIPSAVSGDATTADSPSATTTSTSSQQPEVSDKRVQEAITQLTGQRFEPIKSLSLRSSANKNVKLKDLLFFNPPMTKDQKRHKKSVFLSKKSEKKKNATSNKEADELVDATSPPPTTVTDLNQPVSEPSLVPKVKMGPDGKLVLDESSTIINRKNSLNEQEAIVEDNEDVISRTNYDSFRRKPSQTSQTKWSIEDTKKFYQALTILGTDFSMMESLLFSGLRSRTELHKKFKREERVNKLKIDIALSNRISLNSEELEDLREVFYNS